jgi:hypothetical protein
MHEFDVRDELQDEMRDTRRRLFAIAAALDIALRGVAARRAWRNKHRKWFFALMLVSSGGILPLSYLLFFSRRTDSRTVAAVSD